MDFHNMKRKRLQSLCKKHGIPANLKNTEMAERLSLIFKGKDKSGSSQPGRDDSVMEGTLQCDEDIIILDEEEETQVNELESNNTDNQMVDSDNASGDADLYHGKLGSSHKRRAISSSQENSIPDLLIEGKSAAVIEYMNPLLRDDKCHDHNSAYDYVCEIKRRGFEVEQVETMIHERTNSSKNSQNEVRSDSCNDLDRKRDLFLPTTPQSEAKSGGLHFRQMVASDTSEAKSLSMQKMISVVDSGKCTGFSPELLEASVIKGMEPIAFFTPRISTCDIQDSIQGAKMDMVDRNPQVLHEEPNAVDIHDSNLLKISTEHLEYNLVEREDNNVGDNVHCHDDHRGHEVEMVSPDTSEAKGLSMPKIMAVVDSEEYVGFSPQLLEASVIKGMEPIDFLTPSIATSDMQDSIRSAKMDIVDRSHEVLHEEPNAVDIHDSSNMQDSIQSAMMDIADRSHKVLHEEPNAVDIHDSNLMKISTEHFEYNLEVREDNNVGDYAYVHDDHCGAEVVMVSPALADPSQLKLSQKGSLDEDVEDSNTLSPGPWGSLVIEGTETETKFAPRTTNIVETCDGEKIILSVNTEKVGNSQEVFCSSSNAVVVNDLKPWQDSSEEFSYSVLEGKVKISSDKVDFCLIAGAGTEAEHQVVTKSLEKSNCAKDTLEETSVTCGFSPVEAQSPNYKRMDEARTRLPLSMPQAEVISCTGNIHDMNSSDTIQEMLSEKTSPVADSEIVLAKYVDTKSRERLNLNRTDSFAKTSMAAGCSLREVQFDNNNTDEQPYQFAPAISQTEVDFHNRNIHEMVYSDDTCQLKLLSPEKTSLLVDLEKSCGISPMLPSEVKTFEAKPNSAPKTPTNFHESFVTMEQVGDHQDVFHVASGAVATNEVNLSQVSTEEFCQSLVVGDGMHFRDNGTENGGSESEKQADLLGVESVNIAKDALGNSTMTLGYCLNELQSCDVASGKNSDHPFMLEHGSDTASEDANAYQEKLQSPQKKSSDKNPGESIGFSPKLLESSMIQGLEAGSNLIARTPRLCGTVDMKENMQSAKKQDGTITSKKTARKRQPLQDIQQN